MSCCDDKKPEIVRTYTKSCCGSRALVFDLLKPITRSHIQHFAGAGYFIPPSFLEAGVFYVQNGGLHASASFGSIRISVRCSGDKCEEQIDAFQALLLKAINS